MMKKRTQGLDLPAAEAARTRATAPDATWLNEVRQRLAVGRY